MEKSKKISIIVDDGPRFPMSEMIEEFIENNHRCGFAIIGKNIKTNNFFIYSPLIT